MSDQQNTTSAPAQSDTQQTQVTAQTQATVQQQNTTQPTTTPPAQTQQPASNSASQQDASTAPSGSTQEAGDKETKETINIKDENVEYALRMVPTYVQEFMKVNGMLKEDQPWMNTRQLKEYLSKEEFTPENKKLLEDYLKNKEKREAEFEAYKNGTKKSMKADYENAKQVTPVKVVDSMEKAAERLQYLQAQRNPSKLDEERKGKIKEEVAILREKIEEQRKAMAEYKAKAPLTASKGKTEVTKNGKTKEKDAIIIRDGEKKYVITKDMVKDFRKREGKDQLPSWKKMKDAVEMGFVKPDIIGKLFDENGNPKYGKYKDVEEKPAEAKTAKVGLTSTVDKITPSQTTNDTTPVTQPNTPTQTQSEPVQVSETTRNNNGSLSLRDEYRQRYNGSRQPSDSDYVRHMRSKYGQNTGR